MHLYFFAGNCTENLSRKTEGAELLLPGLLSHGIPVLFTGSGLRIAAVFCIAIYFVFISAPGNEENMPAAIFFCPLSNLPEKIILAIIL